MKKRHNESRLSDKAGLLKQWKKVISSSRFCTKAFTNADIPVSELDDFDKLLPGKFQTYHDRNSDAVVINIKGKGFPDKDDFVSGVLKKLKELYDKTMDFKFSELEASVEERLTEELESWFESYMNNGFWEDVRFETENFDFPKGMTFVTAGRSSGYWGVTKESISYDDICPSEKLLKLLEGKFDSWYDEYEFDLEEGEDENEVMGKIEIRDNEIEDAIYDLLLDLGRAGDISDASYWQLSEQMDHDLAEVEDIILSTVKYFESKERLIDEFMDMKHYEQLATWDEIDVSWHPETDKQLDLQFEKGKSVKTILINEDTKIPGTKIILEKGDRIQVLVEGTIPDKVEDVIKKYEAMDYFEDEQVIQSQLRAWERLGSPEELKGLSGKATPSSIRAQLIKNFGDQRRTWISKIVDRINKKDAKDIKSFLRYDQKMLKDIFSVMTGIPTKGLTDKALAPAIDQWCNS